MEFCYRNASVPTFLSLFSSTTNFSWRECAPAASFSVVTLYPMSRVTLTLSSQAQPDFWTPGLFPISWHCLLNNAAVDIAGHSSLHTCIIRITFGRCTELVQTSDHIRLVSSRPRPERVHTHRHMQVVSFSRVPVLSCIKWSTRFAVPYPPS